MKVSELVEKLKAMPQNLPVLVIYDGQPRLMPNIVYETRDARVMITDFDEYVYSQEARPKDAPTEEQDKYWQTPSDPDDVEI